MIRFAPGVPTELYNGEALGLTNGLSFHPSASGRNRCEFRVEVSNPAVFRKAIRVYLEKGTGPL